MKRMLARLLSVVALALGLIAIPVSARADYVGFPDVSPDAWYVQGGYLDYVLDNDLMQGYENGRFGPGDSVSRAQVVTVLWRVAGEPVADAPDFPDCDYSDTSFYRGAVEWARSTGVVGGYDNGSFGPADDVTREQLAKMLCSYAELVAGIDTSSDCAALDQMSDAGTVSPFARVQMGWAVDRGILTGDLATGQPLARPQASATRDQVSKMITVFHRDVLGGGDLSEDLEFDGSKPSSGDYAPGVVEATQLSVRSVSYNGSSVTADVVGDASDLRPGRIFALERSSSDPFGTVLKLDECTPTNEARTAWRLRGSTVVPSYAYTNLRVNERLSQDSLLDNVGNFKIGASDDIVGVEIEKTEDGGIALAVAMTSDEVEVSGSIKVNDFEALVQYNAYRLPLSAPSPNPFADSKTFYNIDSSVRITPNVRVKINHLPEDVKKTKIGSIPVPFASLPLGVGVYVDFYLVVDITGEVSFSASFSVSGKISKDYSESSPEVSGEAKTISPLDVEAKVKGKVGVEGAVALELAHNAVVDLGFDTGAAAEASAESHPNLTCVSVQSWWYLDIVGEVLGEQTDKLTYRYTVYDENNTPLRTPELHWENGVLVDDCTYDEGTGQSIEWGKYASYDIPTVYQNGEYFGFTVVPNEDGTITGWFAEWHSLMTASVADFYIDLKPGQAVYDVPENRSGGKERYRLTFTCDDACVKIKVEQLSSEYGVFYFPTGTYTFPVTDEARRSVSWDAYDGFTQELVKRDGYYYTMGIVGGSDGYYCDLTCWADPSKDRVANLRFKLRDGVTDYSVDNPSSPGSSYDVSFSKGPNVLAVSVHHYGSSGIPIGTYTFVDLRYNVDVGAPDIVVPDVRVEVGPSQTPNHPIVGPTDGPLGDWGDLVVVV